MCVGLWAQWWFETVLIFGTKGLQDCLTLILGFVLFFLVMGWKTDP